MSKLLVLTSISGWNATLDEAIVPFCGTGKFCSEKFQRTRALDFLVLILAGEDEFSKILVA